MNYIVLTLKNRNIKQDTLVINSINMTKKMPIIFLIYIIKLMLINFYFLHFPLSEQSIQSVSMQSPQSFTVLEPWPFPIKEA